MKWYHFPLPPIWRAAVGRRHTARGAWRRRRRRPGHPAPRKPRGWVKLQNSQGLPFGKLTYHYWKWPIDSWFSHDKHGGSFHSFVFLCLPWYVHIIIIDNYENNDDNDNKNINNTNNNNIIYTSNLRWCRIFAPVLGVMVSAPLYVFLPLSLSCPSQLFSLSAAFVRNGVWPQIWISQDMLSSNCQALFWTQFYAIVSIYDQQSPHYHQPTVVSVSTDH